MCRGWPAGRRIVPVSESLSLVRSGIAATAATGCRHTHAGTALSCPADAPPRTGHIDGGAGRKISGHRHSADSEKAGFYSSYSEKNK